MSIDQLPSGFAPEELQWDEAAESKVLIVLGTGRILDHPVKLGLRHLLHGERFAK